MTSRETVVQVAPGRRRLTPDDRRTQLLRACLDLIGTRPWDEVSMVDVAQVAGVSKPLLYHYFPTKSVLYLAAVRAAADELRRATTMSPQLPPPERFRRALEAHVEWVEANAAAYRAVLQGGISSDEQVQAVIEESRADVVARLAHVAGRPHPTPEQRLVLRGWVGFLEGTCLDWLTTRDVARADLLRILTSSLEVVVRSVGADP